MHYLPTVTIRDLAIIVVYLAGTALEGARKTFARIRPHIQPPPDLEVRSTNGSVYTGVLLVDDNEVIAGLVFRTGHRAPPTSSLSSSSHTAGSSYGGSSYGGSSQSRSWGSPLVTPSRSRYGEDGEEDDDGKLPGWAEGPGDEEGAWVPRHMRR